MLAGHPQAFRSGQAVIPRLAPLACVLLLAGCQAAAPPRYVQPLAGLAFGEAEWQTVVLKGKGGSKESLNWPLDDALAQAAPAGFVDCTLRRPQLACLVREHRRGNTAALAESSFGTDSLMGQAVLLHSDGRLTLYTYDSSPCGGVVPSACGYMLAQAECLQRAALQVDPADQRVLCDKPYFGISDDETR
jgi:hypothetical protein